MDPTIIQKFKNNNYVKKKTFGTHKKRIRNITENFDGIEGNMT
jgi:hypothetical protein